MFTPIVLPFIALARLLSVSPTNGARSPYGTATLQREGDYWALEFDGRVCRLRHAKGVAYLAALLAQPGRRIAALDLHRRVEERQPRPVEGAVEKPDSSEKIRLNVTRALRVMLRKIVAYHPSAGGHLAASIKTGKFCSYTPDPKLGIDWKVSIDLSQVAEPSGDALDPTVASSDSGHGT